MPNTNPKKINHIAILIDRSASTAAIAPQLIEQFNQQAKLINERSNAENQQTHISLYTFSSTADRPLLFEVPLGLVELKPLTRNAYRVEGMTAMYDSLGMAIEDLQHFHRDLNSDDHSFLVLIFTDGHENYSCKYDKIKLKSLMDAKIATDVWSFAFLVPRGTYKAQLVNLLGLSDGNVQEWDTTALGVKEMGKSTTAGIGNYFTMRSQGLRSTKSFFSTNLKNVSTEIVKKDLSEVSELFFQTSVSHMNSGEAIKPFCERYFGSYQLGHAFYELTKPETIQQQKKIVVENKHSGKLYAGSEARGLIGLPFDGEVRVTPGDHGSFRIFIQSTSVNRKLVGGTKLLYLKVASTASR